MNLRVATWNEAQSPGTDAQEAAQAGALLDAFLANSIDYIYFKDKQSRFVRYSRSLLEHFDGPDPEWLKGKTDFDLYVEERARSAFNDEQEILRTGKPLIGKLEKGTRADGKTTWVLTTKMAWLNTDGEIVGTFGISKDVTALKETEAKLAETSNLLETMLEHSPDCIYFKDRESRFIRCSSALATLVHVADPEFLRGKSDFDIFLEEHARAAFDDEQRILKTGQPIVSKPEKETHSDGRTTWALTTKLPWRDKAGNIVGTFGSSKDITAIKEAEAKVEQMHRQLLETSRMAGMAEVATDVLHNVGNVLNSLNVSAHLIRGRLQNSKVAALGKLMSMFREHSDDLAAFLTSDKKGKQMPEFLQQLMGVLLSEREEMLKEMLSVTRNIDHIKDIVAMQQNYAQVSGVTERVQITELAEDAVRMHAQGFSELDLRVVRDYEPGLAEIIVDRHKVLQIVVSIIRNAVQACEGSGHQENRLTIRAAAGKGCVRLQVQDNGVGIPRENLVSIFNHGFTTRPGGHGFGLHMSALAAKELGGSLTVESDGAGMGAAFTLQLPLRPPVCE